MFAEVSGNVEDQDFITKNSGPGKLFPGGPTCHFNGKTVPCFVRWSKTGSITGPILLEILKEMDHRDLFEREKNPGVTPSYICDAHGSRFYLGLLSYQNHPDHKWNGNQGCPNMTADWQLGDSQEQNGTAKPNISKAKADLLLKKGDFGRGINPVVEKYEAIIVETKAFEKGFMEVERNKRAIAERGWNPLNRALLCEPRFTKIATHPDFLSEQDKPYFDPDYFPDEIKNAPKDKESPPLLTNPATHSKLQFVDGYSNTIFMRLVNQNVYEKAVEVSKESYSKSNSLAERLKKYSRLTGGVLFKENETRFGVGVLERKARDEREKWEKVKADKRKKRNKFTDGRNAFLKVRKKMEGTGEEGTGVSYKNLTNEELKDLVKFKRKSRGEKDRLPSSKTGLIKMYEEYFLGPNRRLTPVTSPANSDDEGDTDENLNMIKEAEKVLALNGVDVSKDASSAPSTPPTDSFERSNEYSL